MTSTSDPMSIDAYDTTGELTCDNCDRSKILTTLYALPSTDSTFIRHWRIPAKYDTICSSCFETVNDHTPSDLTDTELIAAIMSDSLGYASPAHASRHITDYQNDESETGCERGTACFDRDLSKLMESARKRWLTRDEAEREQLLNTVERWQTLEDEQGTARSMMASLSYPVTMAVPDPSSVSESVTSQVDTAPQDSLFCIPSQSTFFSITTLDDDTYQINEHGGSTWVATADDLTEQFTNTELLTLTPTVLRENKPDFSTIPDIETWCDALERMLERRLNPTPAHAATLHHVHNSL